jgi:hypothetical protein
MGSTRVCDPLEIELMKGTFPMLMFVALISFCSIVFVGGSSSPGPKGTYSVPDAGGIR